MSKVQPPTVHTNYPRLTCLLPVIMKVFVKCFFKWKYKPLHFCFLFGSNSSVVCCTEASEERATDSFRGGRHPGEYYHLWWRGRRWGGHRGFRHCHTAGKGERTSGNNHLGIKDKSLWGKEEIEGLLLQPQAGQKQSVTVSFCLCI